MPHLCFFVVEFVTFLGVFTGKWVWTLLWVRNKSISNGQVKVATENKNAIFFPCELWVKRVCTFGVVLYRNQWPVHFLLYFADVHIGRSIKYENTLFKYYFLKCYNSPKKFNILQLFFWVYIRNMSKSLHPQHFLSFLQWVVFMLILEAPLPRRAKLLAK